MDGCCYQGLVPVTFSSYHPSPCACYPPR
jgi:hypothetical protein